MKCRESFLFVLGLILILHELAGNVAGASPPPAARGSGTAFAGDDIGLFQNATAQKVIVESELLNGSMIAEVVPGDVGPLPIRDGGLITISSAPSKGRSMLEMFKYVIRYRTDQADRKHRFRFVVRRERLEAKRPITLIRSRP
jgi:hypothetical protein